MRNTKLLLVNTAVMTAGGFLMRTISVSFNVYLTGKIGTAGIGLFQLIMSVYGLLTTFAAAGIRLGTTRLVADSICRRPADSRGIMRVCISYALTASVAVAGITYIFSPIISKSFINDVRAGYSLKILSLSLPPVAVSAAMNGYFTARKTMYKFSIIQLIEQLFKIVVTVVLIFLFSGKGLQYLCGAVCAGITLSESLSCIMAYILYRAEERGSSKASEHSKIISSLVRITAPDAIGSGMRSVLLTVEHLLIPVGFRKSGQSTDEALATYGIVHGMALPVILYPAAVLTSLSSMIVPELSALLSFGRQKEINDIVNNCLRTATVFSAGTAAFIFAFSDTISCAVYGSGESTFYLKLLSFLLPIMYLDTMVDGMLKGLDQQAASMRYNVFDSGLCVVLVFFLLPKFAVKGYIFILFLSEIINFSFSFNRLLSVTQITANIVRDFFKPAITAAGISATVNLINSYILSAYSEKVQMIISIVVFAVLYVSVLIALGCIKKSEVKNFTAKIKA